MRRAAIVRFGIAVVIPILAGTAACAPTWKHAGGPRELSPAGAYLAAGPPDAAGTLASSPVLFTVPDGWHWYFRGEDFIATRDGVFLQQIFVERLRIDQVDQKVNGAFPLAVLSSKLWPTRTAKSLMERFAAGMPPADAAEVLLASRRNDPSIADLRVRKIVTRTVAGQQAFRVVFDFRLKDAVVDPSPLYRSLYCGFMRGDWFYGVSYTAAARYYFDRDAAAFETFLESVRLDPSIAGKTGDAAASAGGAPTQKTGLLPPAIVQFEGSAGVTDAQPTPNDEASFAAAEAVRAAVLADMAARTIELVVIGKDELGSVDLKRLYSIPARIALDDVRPVPEALLTAEYPPGSLATLMERRQLDAVWVVAGIAIVPEESPRPPGPAGSTARRRLLLRAALVDRQGTVLFSDVIDESDVTDDADAVDLRDRQTARRQITALLAEYRTERETSRAEQDVAQALETKAAAPRSPHPSEVRFGVGAFTFVPDGVDLMASVVPKNARWQFGYRYLRWTDTFHDPYTGNELTEATETLHGPQVNYLFRPHKRGTPYVGMSVLQWLRTERSTITGASSSDSVVAPFFGGGYTRRLGRHVYFNAAMFVGVGARLDTDTGVSSEESSGGFDIQLQMGAVF